MRRFWKASQLLVRATHEEQCVISDCHESPSIGYITLSKASLLGCRDGALEFGCRIIIFDWGMRFLVVALILGLPEVQTLYNT